MIEILVGNDVVIMEPLAALELLERGHELVNPSRADIDAIERARFERARKTLRALDPSELAREREDNHDGRMTAYFLRNRAANRRY